MRARLILLVLLPLILLAPAARAVEGFNLPGGDYTNFPAASWFVCRNSCGGDSRCQGWTWVRPGIQGSAGRCWLKSRLPQLVKDTCCHSGSGANIRKADLKAEDKTNRPGSDINNFVVRGWQACEAACAGEARCAAWSYVRPGVQGPQARCWIKLRAPNPVADANVISGVKWRPRSVRID
jgi:PAN domain